MESVVYDLSDTPDLSDKRHKLISIINWFFYVGVFTGVRFLAQIRFAART